MEYETISEISSYKEKSLSIKPERLFNSEKKSRENLIGEFIVNNSILKEESYKEFIIPEKYLKNENYESEDKYQINTQYIKENIIYPKPRNPNYSMPPAFERPDIIIDGKTYRWVSNFISFSPQDIEIACDKARSESTREAAAERVVKGNNRVILFEELARRGIGIISEEPAAPGSKGLVPDFTHDFYQLDSLPISTFKKLQQEISKLFPGGFEPFYGSRYGVLQVQPKIFSQPELAELLDTVLAQDQFAKVLAISQAHLGAPK